MVPHCGIPITLRGSQGMPAVALLVLLTASAACTDLSQARLARRILEDHRATARVKPLPAAQVIRLRLTLTSSDGSGSERIEWDEDNYRETLSSASWTAIRGIQAGKGYFTDEDGVTRVVSEPVLSELVTRSYFWRRDYLFDDQKGARLALGPAADATVSVRVTPRGGDPLLLTFARSDLRLLAARSRRFDLAFSSPTRFRDFTRRQSPVEAEILGINLPTGRLADTAAGGWSARWGAPAAEVAFLRVGWGITAPARISGQPVQLQFDAAEDGPIRVRSAVADRLGLSYARDIFGRLIARGARLEIGQLSWESLTVEKSDSLPEGIDAAAGAALLRETVVEIDPETNVLRLHDPARWVNREGFFRALLDDDGNRCVAILRRKGETLRLLAPTAIPGPLELTADAERRFGFSGLAPRLAGLRWGPALPELSVLVGTDSETDLGEDGRLGWDLVLRFHSFFDLPHRWVYLKPRTSL